jgi:hypothetical protein
MKHNGSQKANIIRFVGKNMDKMEDLNQQVSSINKLNRGNRYFQMLIRNNSFDVGFLK